ncbi:MAG: AMP-dependent synthetase [Cytophagales bacterium]|nr:MAG: AMP-dependent synthetase [Cytophagales bacterium]
MENTATLAGKSATNANKQAKPLIEYFYRWEKERPNNTYLRQPIGDDWQSYTFSQVSDQARRIASALQAMGLQKGDNVGLVSKNCVHWVINDLAIMMGGFVSVPFYPTLNSEQLREVVEHSGCKVLFVGKLDEPVWKDMKAGIPDGVKVVTYPQYSYSAKIEGDGYIKWDDLCKTHSPMEGNYVPDINDLATIIYTSGTTGMPKGVMHTYFTMFASLNAGAGPLMLDEGDGSARFFSYLPLCHIAERAIVETASLYSGGMISFAETLDSFPKNLAATQPTHFLAVPRIWTKFQLGILAKMSQSKLNLFLKIPILNNIVRKKIKTGLGLSEAKLILTGAAPMPASLIQWFQKLGIIVQEAYGMTENGGCCTLMRKNNIKMGTIGQLYDGAEVKIDPDSGEILMKADWVMTGYYKEPEKTAETIKDGWLHTGDAGNIDKDKFLTITGRVKDTFKTAKGEFIVPAPIEFGFAQNNYIEQVCLTGRTLPQPVALVVLSEIGKAEDKDVVTSAITESLDALNATLRNFEKVEKVIVVKEAWAVENGVLTPTLKIKRNIIEQKYNDKLENWYQSKDKIVWE